MRRGVPGEADRVSGCDADGALQAQHDALAAKRAIDDRVGTEVFDRRDLRCNAGALCDADVLGPDAGKPCGAVTAGERARGIGGQPRQIHDVHRWRADEACRKDRCRAGIERSRCRVLFDPAVAQQDHLVGHAHRLDLVVRDVDHRDAELLLQAADLAPHFLAQLRVEVRKRLVHQAHRGLRDDRPPERDALLLAARELRGLAVEQCREAQQLGDARQAPRMVALLAHLQAEQDVLAHVEVRKERVRLEHHREPPLARREPRDVAPVDDDAPRARCVEPGDQAQGRRLAAARRPEQHDEGAGGGLEARVVDRRLVPPEPGDMLQPDRTHGRRTGRFMSA